MRWAHPPDPLFAGVLFLSPPRYALYSSYALLSLVSSMLFPFCRSLQLDISLLLPVILPAFGDSLFRDAFHPKCQGGGADGPNETSFRTPDNRSPSPHREHGGNQRANSMICEKGSGQAPGGNP